MENEFLNILAICVCFAGGIVFCFFGNRWLKIILAAYGFIAGFAAGHALLMNFTALSGTELILCSLGAGAALATLLVLLLYLGIFLIGFGGGVFLGLLAADVLNISIWDPYLYISILVVGCILGALTLNLRRIFISIFTSFIGASLLALGIYHLSAGNPAQMLEHIKDSRILHTAYTSTVYLASLAALFFTGLAVQLTITGKKKAGAN
jgi:hypothetical protein